MNASSAPTGFLFALAASIFGAVWLGVSIVRSHADPAPVQPGGRFAFPYPNFTNAPGTLTLPQYAQTIAGLYHHPGAFRFWVSQGTDPRVLNPNGVYLKHINVRTLYKPTDAEIGDHPPHDWILQNHPEWVIRDRNGNTVPLFLPGEVSVDFGNPAYLDYVWGTWFPTLYGDALDRDPNVVTWYLHDNGNFDRMFIDCGPNNPDCEKYNTDEGMRQAWEAMLGAFKARWPNKRLLISTGPVTYKPVADQMAAFQRVLGKADGYYSETFTNDYVYWNDQPNAGKRLALETTRQLAGWLAANGKVFFPNTLGAGNTPPSQAAVDYAWAFFNLMREGPWQFFSQATKDAAGNWVPRVYPEMSLPLGDPTEAATVIAPNVWRRDYTKSVALVNLSDSAVAVTLPPAGAPYRNARGQTVASPLTLGELRGADGVQDERAGRRPHRRLLHPRRPRRRPIG